MPFKRKVLLGSISVMHEVWLPYASGILQEFAKKNSRVNENYEFLPPLYKFQELEAVSSLLGNTDILALTCYIWNQEYNLALAREFKKIKPTGFVVFGGPNIPKDPSLQKTFATKNSACDIFFTGPGEHSFVRLLLGLLGENIFNLPSSFGFHGGTFFATPGDPPQLASHELPNPYHSNHFRDIPKVEKRVKCSFETNRGCPYRCAFCDWGGTAKSKVVKFDLQIVQDVLEAIFSMENIVELEILDANLGLFRRDIEIIEKMCEFKQRYDRNFNVSYSGLAKNGSPYLEKILELLVKHFNVQQRNLKISFQTHTDDVLKIAQRENIRSEKMMKLVTNLKSKNIGVSSEMIIGLPGETASSWLQTLEKDFSAGLENMRCYILNLVCNTDMYSEGFREKNKVKSKKVKFPYHYSSLSYRHLFDGYSPIVSIDQFEEVEVIYQCASYDTDELVKMFDYWWFYHNLINTRILFEPIQRLQNRGIRLSEIIANFYAWLPENSFFSKVVQKSRSAVKSIFSPEDETIIYDLGTYFFFSRCLRLDEIYHFWCNQEALKDELNDFLGFFSEGCEQEDLVLSPYRPGHTWTEVKNYYGTDVRISPQVSP